MREQLRLFIWLLFLCGSCLGRVVVDKSNLRVFSPNALKGVHECAIGTVGLPQYGGAIIGTLIYLKANQKACKSFDELDISFKLRPGALPIILLADRGDCYFTLKTWNAQNAGAAAIIVADDITEPLLTMDTQEEENPWSDYGQNITIPSAFISKTLGDSIKKALWSGYMVNIILDWKELLLHPERVRYEFWTNSNDGCGPKCESQIEFFKNFKGAAQILEKKGYAQFTPHYITWYCPKDFIKSKECRSQCINRGRYCAPDPEQGDFSRGGYNGKDVVVENLRRACLFKAANENGKPWLWWDYVTDFSIRCPMKERKLNKNCADQVVKSLGFDINKIDKCIGDPGADEENPVLKAEQDALFGKGYWGELSHLPIQQALVINKRAYIVSGNLDKGTVLEDICMGTSKPGVCLSEEMKETNECLENNGGCWQNKAANITACKDTFRGRVCECPTVQGIKFVGDGYTHCRAPGSLRCEINNGGCWNDTQDGITHSACIEDNSKDCKCPMGFKGDGVNTCEDVDECKEKFACLSPECTCNNIWGSYECICNAIWPYMPEHDIREEVTTMVSWHFVRVIFLCLAAAAGVGGYTLYKDRIGRYMDLEIRAVMEQHMPLDNKGEPLITSPMGKSESDRREGKEKEKEDII